MHLWLAALLGLVQGVTEFLPISSDGHLAVVQLFFQVPNNLVFTVWLHLATLAAVGYFFWREIRQLTVKGWVWLAVGTIPAALVGVLADKMIERASDVLWIVALGFLVTAAANFLSQHLLRREGDGQWPSLRQTLVIGTIQSAALMPGISRSGLTVASGLALGLSRERAFRFSFLLLVPATLGAVGLETLKLLLHAGSSVPAIAPTIIAMAIAFISGLASLQLLQLMIKRAKMDVFGWYCLGMGVLLLVLSFAR